MCDKELLVGYLYDELPVSERRRSTGIWRRAPNAATR